MTLLELLCTDVTAVCPGFHGNWVFGKQPIGLQACQVGIQSWHWIRLHYGQVHTFATWLAASGKNNQLTLCMLGNFFRYVFLSKDAKYHCFLPNILLIYNLDVKQCGSQMKPHILWGFIWIQIVCIGHQRSSKFTASGLRVIRFLYFGSTQFAHVL